MNTLTKVDNTAWQRHQRLQEMNVSVKLHFLAIGDELDKFTENKEYLDIGYDSFDEYIADPENRYEFSVRTAYRMIRAAKVARLYGDDRVLDAGISKTCEIAGYLTDKNDAELFNMASTLSRSDLKIELGRRFEGGNGELDYCVCEKCGNRHRREP